MLMALVVCVRLAPQPRQGQTHNAHGDTWLGLAHAQMCTGGLRTAEPRKLSLLLLKKHGLLLAQRGPQRVHLPDPLAINILLLCRESTCRILLQSI